MNKIDASIMLHVKPTQTRKYTLFQRESLFVHFQWFSILVMLIVLSFSIQCSVKKEKIPQISDIISEPFQEVTGSTLYCYSGSNLMWKLNTDYTRKLLNDTSSMLVVPVRMTIYDTTSKKTTIVLSDSGTTDMNLDKFYIWGNVYIKTWDGFTVHGKSLWHNKQSGKIGSDDYVEMKTPKGDKLRGKGLDATETFSHWSLRQSVSGEFPEFNDMLDSQKNE